MASSKIVFKPRGTCSSEITVEADDGIIKNVNIFGGCEGNLKGLSNLLPGMRTSDVIERLEGIKCGNKNTSCPDQLAKALKKIEN